jgi:hypothetical protein
LKFIKEGLIDKKGELDSLDWLMLGTHNSRNNEEEIAF